MEEILKDFTPKLGENNLPKVTKWLLSNLWANTLGSSEILVKKSFMKQETSFIMNLDDCIQIHKSY